MGALSTEISLRELRPRSARVRFSRHNSVYRLTSRGEEIIGRRSKCLENPPRCVDTQQSNRDFSATKFREEP